MPLAEIKNYRRTRCCGNCRYRVWGSKCTGRPKGYVESDHICDGHRFFGETDTNGQEAD